MMNRLLFLTSFFFSVFSFRQSFAHIFDTAEVNRVKMMEQDLSPEEYVRQRRSFFINLNNALAESTSSGEFIGILNDYTLYAGTLTRDSTLSLERTLMLGSLQISSSKFKSLNPTGDEWKKFFDYYTRAVYGGYYLNTHKKANIAKLLLRCAVGAVGVCASLAILPYSPDLGSEIFAESVIFPFQGNNIQQGFPKDTQSALSRLFTFVLGSDLEDQEKARILTKSLAIRDVFDDFRLHFLKRSLPNLVNDPSRYGAMLSLSLMSFIIKSDPSYLSSDIVVKGRNA